MKIKTIALDCILLDLIGPNFMNLNVEGKEQLFHFEPTPTTIPILKRLFAVGDIHGMLKKLESLIHQIDPAKDDVLIFLGDYTDRGKKSYGVIRFLEDLAKSTRCVFLSGNHEVATAFTALNDTAENLLAFKDDGGFKTLKSFPPELRQLSVGKLLKTLIPFYQQLHLAAISTGFFPQEYFFSHAGINPTRSLLNQNIMDLLFTRELFLNADLTGLGFRFILGHSPTTEERLAQLRPIGVRQGSEPFRPLVTQSYINIDTRAFKQGPLTAVSIPDEGFFYSD